MSGQSGTNTPLFSADEIEAARRILASVNILPQVMGPQSHRDVGGSLKTTVPKLVEGKFHFWRNRMETILEDHGLLQYVESEVPQPIDSVSAVTWRKAMNSTKSIIKMGLTDQQLLPLMHLDTPCQMWKTLIESQVSDASTVTMTLMKKLTTFRMDAGKTMTQNINGIRDILVQLKAVQETVPENLVKSIVLTSLPDGYESFQTTMESVMYSSEVPMSLENLFTRILAREASMKVQTTTHDSALFTGDKKASKKGSNRFRPKTPSGPANSPVTSSDSEKKSKVALHDKYPCHRCKKLGHWKHNCPLNAQAPTEDVNVHEEEESDEVAYVTTTYSSESSCVWYLDTAATMHMTHQLDLLSNFKNIPPVAIRLGNDHIVHATGEGQVSLTFPSNSQIPPFLMKKVWYVPELSKNLFATHMLPPGLVTRIHSTGFDIVNSAGEIFLTGIKTGKLLILGPLEMAALTEECHFSESVLWHKRFGHISPAALHKMKETHTVKGLEQAQLPSHSFNCEVCVSGKHTKHSYHENSAVKSTVPLELIYSDVYGPLPVPSIGGKRFILTFVDDFSRYTWIYFLTKKSEVLTAFQLFVLEVERQFEYPVKKLFSDNGGEYISKRFKTFCASKGIRHFYSAPYASPQNGIAERLNRTMAEKARCMLLEAHLDQKFWAEAFATAIYLKNRSSTRSLPSCVTPYEVLEGSTPTVHHLKIFGCLAFKLVPSQKRNKLDCKTEKLIFLGYDPTGNYRLWNPVTEKLVISKDVKFFETHSGVQAFTLPEQEEDNDEFIPLAVPGTPLPSVPVQPIPLDPPEVPEVPLQNHEDTTLTDTVSSDSLPAPDVLPDTLTSRETTRSGRPIVLPRRFEDYAMMNECDSDSDDECANLSSICTTPDPDTYKEAITGPDAQNWITAIHEELHSHYVNGTWELVPLPPDRTPVGSKWVFKVKRTKDGQLERFKARLVAQGFSQRPGVDYNETFAPVAKLDSIRVLLSLATVNDWEIQHMDVKTAFLYGKLQEEVYMKVPEGGIPDTDTTGKVCHLLKSLYGLKQASRVWYQELDKKLTSLGFLRTYMDTSVFTLSDSGTFLYLAVWVDDILLIGPQSKLIHSVKTLLRQSFQMSDLGDVSYLLGIDVTRDRTARSMTLHQGLYLKHLLTRFKMESANPIATPMEPKCPPALFHAPDNAAEIAEMQGVPYAQLIGSLMYAMLGTRPDLAYPVSFLSQFLINPGKCHWSAAKRVLRFLKFTLEYRLTYSASGNHDIVGYSDSDWGGDLASRKSTSGYVFILAGGAVTWKSRKQSTVALSSTEAEYMAVAMATSEALWLKNLLFELAVSSISISRPLSIFCDNQGCVFVTKNPKEHSRLKHIDLRYMFVRDAVEKNKISVSFCSTSVMAADVLTKPLAKEKFYRCLTLFGLKN